MDFVSIGHVQWKYWSILRAWPRNRKSRSGSFGASRKIAAKAVRLGALETPDEAIAIEKGAAEFKVPARLMTTGR
jgi:hypothetical protein